MQHHDSFLKLLEEEKKAKKEAEQLEFDSRLSIRKRRGGLRRDKLVFDTSKRTIIPQYKDVTKWGIKSNNQLQTDSFCALWLAAIGSPFNIMKNEVTVQFLGHLNPEYNVKSPQTYLRYLLINN